MAANLDIRGALACLSLTRPPVNALDLRALEMLENLVDRIENDRVLKVVIIDSGLEGLFCTGGDMKFWPREYPDQPDFVSRAGCRLFDRIERLPQTFIGLINGKVIGDGLSLALACDLRFASDVASFQVPEVAYGFIPGWGTIGRMVREIGKAAATELLLIGEPVDAAAALRMGLVHRVFGAEEVDAATRCLAVALAEKPITAMRQAKTALCGSIESIRTQLELDCFKAVWGSDEWNTEVVRVFKAAIHQRRTSPPKADNGLIPRSLERLR